jgi:hypothetical protein
MDKKHSFPFLQSSSSKQLFLTERAIAFPKRPDFGLCPNGSLAATATSASQTATKRAHGAMYVVGLRGNLPAVYERTS